MQEQSSEFDAALGVYVGPATMAEAINALASHTPGEWVMRLTDSQGDVVSYRRGWSWYIADDDERAVFAVSRSEQGADVAGDGERAVFALSRSEQGAGNPAVFVDAPLVLSFAKRLQRLTGDCDLYSGGLVFRLGSGDYAGHTLTLVARHESGDIAPGFRRLHRGD